MGRWSKNKTPNSSEPGACCLLPSLPQVYTLLAISGTASNRSATR
ncbi:hypothetical protein SAMN04487855_1855, partial [Halopseudomonas bauzanensis]